MKSRHFIALTAITLASTACQDNSFRIEGKTDGISNGDTLFMTQDMDTGIPSDTLIVKDGRFQLESQSDSARLTLLFSPAQPNVSVLFFAEPGTINITLAQTPDKTTIGGTKANDALQELNTVANAYGQKMQELAAVFYNPTASDADKKAAMDKEHELQARLSEQIIGLAENNIDNELGFFLVTNFDDEELFSLEKRQELIGKMPARFSQRTAVKELLQLMEARKAVVIGKPISDFTLNTPEGTPLSVMSEVAKNKLTILDFWASWCGPCRQEMPFMVSLYNKYHDQGLGIVGISLDEDKASWVKAIAQLKITWPQMSDLKGWKSEAGQQFQVNAIPFIVIVDQKGNIMQKGLRGEKLEAFVSQHLEQ